MFAIFARGHGRSGALEGKGVCAFLLARVQANAPQLVTGARFGEVALACVHEGQAHFLILVAFFQGLGGLYVCILAARLRGRSGVHDDRGVFALGDH